MYSLPRFPGPTLHVYDYRADRMVELAEVRLGLSSTSISVKDDVLYLTSAHSVRVSNPYWCQNYGTVREMMWYF